MSSVVAIVKSIVGQVIAVSPEGIRRVLIEGDRLFAGEQALTGPEGAVTLELADGRSIDLGRDTQWSADAPDSATNLAEATAQAAPSVAELQQAIAAGADPTQDLEATAAGPAAAGVGGVAGGGHSFVVLDATAGVVAPTIGFPTAGIGLSTLSTTQTAAALDTSTPLRASTLTVTATQTLTEAGGTLVYTATVTQAPLTDLTITLSNGQTIVIAGGQTTGSSSLQIQDHNTPYTDPSQISTTVTGTTGGGGLVLTIDPTPAVTQITDTIDTTTVTLTAGSNTATEGTSITYTATLTNPAQTPVTVTLSDGSTITIEAGQSTGSINVPAPANDVYNTNTTLSTTITGATGGNFESLVPNPAPAVVTVTDSPDTTVASISGNTSVTEGETASYTISLTHPTQTEVTVNLTYSGTAADGSDFTGVASIKVPANASSVTFDIRTINDTLTETTENFTVKINSVTGGNFEQLVISETHGSVTTSIIDNDALPVVVLDTASEGSNYKTAFTEGDTGVSIVGQLSISDVDSPQLQGATVTLTNAQADDTLLVGSNNPAITVVTTTTVNGELVLTLKGAATPADYQAVIQSITFSNSSENPSAIDRTITITVNDGQHDSVASSTVIAVTPVNDAPVVVLAEDAPAFTEGQDNVAVAGNLSLSDVDNDTLQSGTVTLTGAQDTDTLTVGSPNAKITVTTTEEGGNIVLTLSGEATKAEYQTLIQSITYSNTSQDPGVLPREISVVVHDGKLDSNVATTPLNFTAVNDAPEATGSAITGTEDTAQTLHWSDFGVTDVDSAATSLGIVLTQLPANGTLQLNGVDITSLDNLVISKADIEGGKLTFAPVANASGSDYASIGFQPSDGTALLGTAATVTINVTAVADAPTLEVALAAGDEDTAISLTINPALVDKDGSETLSTVISDIPIGAVLTDGVHSYTSIIGGDGAVVVSSWNLSTLTITPPLNFNGPITLTVTSTATEKAGGDAASTVKELTVNVAPVNDAPVVHQNGDVTFNSQFTEGDAIGAKIVSSDLTITDVDNQTLAGATVKLSNPQSGDTFLAPESNTISAVQTTVNGALVLTLTGTATAAEYAAYIKQITFSNDSQDPSPLPRELTISVTDGTDSSILVNTTIAVVPVNDAPIVVNATGNNNEDHLVTVNLSGSDVDGNVAHFKLDSLPSNGKLYSDAAMTHELSAGDMVDATVDGKAAVYFMPTQDWSGSTNFTFTSIDNQGMSSATIATGSIVVAPVTDTPHLALTANSTVTTINFDDGKLGAAWHTDNSGGTVEIGKGTVYGAGTDNLVVELERNTGDPSNLYTTVEARAGATYTVSVDYSPRDGALDNSLINVFWGTTQIGTLNASEAGMKTYTFEIPVTTDGAAKLEFRAADSNSVGGVLDNISVTETLNTGLEDHAILLSTIEAYATDIDHSESFKLQISNLPVGSTITDGTGAHTFTSTVGNTVLDITDWKLSTLMFTPPANANGLMPLTVTATAQDGTAAPVSETITIPVKVIAVNDAPIIDVVANNLTEDNTSAGTVAGKFTISDIETATADLKVSFTGNTNNAGYYTIAGTDVLLTAKGAAFVNAGNKLPAIDLTVSDGDKTGHDSATPTVTLVNDAPVIDVTANSLTENSVAAGTVAGKFTISDEDTATKDLTVSFTGTSNSAGYYAVSGSNVILTAAGAAFVNAGNKLPAIDLTVSDGQKTGHDSATPTVTLVNDAPVIDVTANSLTEDSVAAGTVAGKFTISDEETATKDLTVNFTTNTNNAGYYTIAGTDVLLTAKGAAFVNAGNKLPAIDLTVSDGQKAGHDSATPTVTLVNDAPVIDVIANSLTEDAVTTGTVAGKFTIGDEDTATANLTVGFTGTTNSAGYYAIAGSNVVLTAAGAAFVNAGNKLPAIDLTVNDGQKTGHDSDTPAVTLVNDAPVIDVIANSLTEDAVTTGTVAGTFKVSDEDTLTANLKVDFTGTTNSAGYYAIAGSNVVLTAAGAAFVNAGNKLPAIDLTVNDG
ncbi:MAG: retention module-containing protein, partial [Pseudomonas sp.]